MLHKNNPVYLCSIPHHLKLVREASQHGVNTFSAASRDFAKVAAVIQY